MNDPTSAPVNRRSSTRLNVKLREVALRLTETGEVDAKDVTTDVG